MSLARKHREKFADIRVNAVYPETSGLSRPAQPAGVPTAGNSLAQQRKARQLATATAMAGELSAPERGSPEARAAAQMRLRLQHDLRRLKEIASIERKIETKRQIPPEYAAWVDGLVAAGTAHAEDVLPTVMIWRIDTGDFTGALTLAEHVLRHDLPLPTRYERSAPALIAEEIATAAFKAQGLGHAFDIDILDRVDALTADADMHDEIRAKLAKAIGVERMRQSEDETGEPLARTLAAAAALDCLRRAQHLHDRVGVKDRIKRLEKRLASPKDIAAPAA